jgi:hypothetical protein
LPNWLNAQTAEDYFHGGAQFYIFGEKQKAVTEVQTGLQKFPHDAELRKLAELLAKEEQQQRAQQNQKEEQKEKQEQEQARQQKEKQEQEQQQQQQAQNQSQQQEQKQQPNQSSEQKEKEQQANQNESSAAYAAGQMTPQQAQQLLDAQKNEEMLLPVKPEQKSLRGQKKLRDW